MLSRYSLAAAILAMPLVFDLAVKKLTQHTLDFGSPIAVFPGFNLTLLFNPGVSFGLFPVGSDTGLIFMLLVQSVLCLGIAIYAWMQRDNVIVWPLLLLLSGALGNLVDRFLNGAVTDYLDFYIGTYHWPAFNLADVWITLGVAGLIAAEVFGRTPDKQTVKHKG